MLSFDETTFLRPCGYNCFFITFPPQYGILSNLSDAKWLRIIHRNGFYGSAGVGVTHRSQELDLIECCFCVVLCALNHFHGHKTLPSATETINYLQVHILEIL